MNRAERRADFLSRHRRAQPRAGLVNESANQSTASHANLPVSDAQRASNVQLRIEELVLHGFVPRDRYVIGDAVQQELTRLFVARGVPAQLIERASAARLDAGSFKVSAESKTHTVGAQIAGAVYGGWKR